LKIAVFADVHGNLPAFEVIADHVTSWRPDIVVLAGDVVNRGPRPVACLDLLLEKQQVDGWRSVRGNHEDYVLDQAKLDSPRSGPLFDISRNAYWTYQKLKGRVKALEIMPFQVSVDGLGGGEVRVVHASMRGNRDGIYPETDIDELRLQIAPAPAVLCVGHTHRPLIRQVDATLVVNVGSVGSPFDGDVRACYAQLTWVNKSWDAKIVRLNYDRNQTERDYIRTGFIERAGSLATLMLLEFQQAKAHIHLFFRRYERAILESEIGLNDAVIDYLSRIGQ
jgi:predicted phosphodiesterase